MNSWHGMEKVVPYLLGERVKLALFALSTRLLLLFIATLFVSVSTNKNAAFLDVGLLDFNKVVHSFRYADVVWYLDIAENGYSRSPFSPFKKANWAFYPVWPLLLRGCNVLFGEMVVSGIVLSTVFFVLGILVLYQLILLDYERDVARTVAVLVLLFPVSYFCLRPGPESLFMLLVLGSLYSARINKWAQAGMLAALATLTRPQGAVLLFPLLSIYYKQYMKGGYWNRGVVSLFLIPFAQLGFMSYLYLLTGNPFASFLMQKAWDNNLSIPFAGVVRFALRPHLISYYGWDLAAVTVLFILGSVILFALMFRVYPLPGEYILYTGFSMFFIVARANMNASLRYMIPIFPLFLVLALMIRNRKWLYDGVMFGFASLQIFYFLAFLQHYNWASN